MRELLSETWNEDALALFFGERPVAEWFNISNPRVKSGELLPAEISAAEALKMMVGEPLLIVRPLMQAGDQRLAGFEVAQVHSWIGLALDSVGKRDPKTAPA